MNVLSIDSGANCGWCVLRCVPGRMSWVDGGTMRHDDPELDKLIANFNWPNVVVEVPAGYAYEAKRVAGLLGAAEVGGGLIRLAKWTGHNVVRMTAADWRLRLCGKMGPTDAEVKAAVTRAVAGVPRCSADARDAVGAAWWSVTGKLVKGVA